MKQKLKQLARGITLSLILLSILFGSCYLLGSFYECTFQIYKWSGNTKGWVIFPFLLMGTIGTIAAHVYLTEDEKSHD